MVHQGWMLLEGTGLHGLVNHKKIKTWRSHKMEMTQGTIKCATSNSVANGCSKEIKPGIRLGFIPFVGKMHDWKRRVTAAM